MQENILIIAEDDLGDIYYESLLQNGVRQENVFVPKNQGELAAILQQYRVDVVFTDTFTKNPDFNGRNVIEKVRTFNPKARVVVVSGGGEKPAFVHIKDYRAFIAVPCVNIGQKMLSVSK